MLESPEHEDAYLRAAALREMEEREAEQIKEWLDAWYSAGTQQRIRQTLAALAAKGSV